MRPRDIEEVRIEVDWSVNETVCVFQVVHSGHGHSCPSLHLVHCNNTNRKTHSLTSACACASHVTQGDSRLNFSTGRSRAVGPLPIFRAPLAC